MSTAILPLLLSLYISISAGLAATTYVNILTQPGQVLAFWARWLYTLRDWYIEPKREFREYIDGLPDDTIFFDAEKKSQKRRERIADYLLKPILTCVYCVGGQVGFWLSVYVSCSYFTFDFLISLLTAVLSVWMGGLFQYVQQRLFPL